MRNLTSVYGYMRFVILGLVIFGLTQIVHAQDLERYTFQSRHMGAQFSMILYAESEEHARTAQQAAFYRVEELNQKMSDYIEDSELNRLSRLSGSGEFMELSDDLFYMLEESIRVSELSDGIFDITVGPMTRAWRVTRMMPEPELPTENELEELMARVGYQYIELDYDSNSARLLRPDMQLDLGGIAKGYAAEEAVKTLREHGITSVLVDAGGDITVGDPPPGRESWDVAVPKILQDSGSSGIMLKLYGKTVTTSGDMFQFIEIEGERYSHIINPKTGLGSTNRMQATVLSKNGSWADAFASVLTLKDPEEGIALIERLDNTEAIVFQYTDDGIKEWQSSGFQRYLR